MIRNRNVANAGWIISCKIVQALLGVVISMLTARYLGPSNFGVINYAAAVVAFVAPVAKLGLSHVVIQELVYSPDSEGKILGSSLVMSIISSFLCILGVIAFAMVTNPNENDTILVCALYSILLFSHALEVIQYWFQAKLLSKYVSVVSVIAYVIISLYKAVLLLTRQSVYWFAVSNAIDHLIIGVVLLVIYRKISNHRLRFSWDWAKRIVNQSRFFIVSSMMITIFAQTDKIMLKFMIGDEATGLYSAATACAGMTSFVFAAIIDSMRPTILEHKKNKSPLYEKYTCYLYAIIIYMALAQSVMMTVLAKPVILILYGQEYMRSVLPLQLVVWHTTFSYIGSVRSVWILAEGQQRYLWVLNLSGALTNILLNAAFIPLWGIEGAAIASIITQIFTNYIIGFFIKPIRPNNALIIRSLHPRCLFDIFTLLVSKKHGR